MNTSVEPTVPFRISTLVFLRDGRGRLLLIRRAKAPNYGKWSPIGGKLDIGSGESPYQCAMRETMEETGLQTNEEDLRLFAYVSEKNYEGESHWLMFLFDCLKPIPATPPDHPREGTFGLFEREELDDLDLPDSDHLLVWPLYDQRLGRFAAIRANCKEDGLPKIKVEAPASFRKSS